MLLMGIPAVALVLLLGCGCSVANFAGACTAAQLISLGSVRSSTGTLWHGCVLYIMSGMHLGVLQSAYLASFLNMCTYVLCLNQRLNMPANPLALSPQTGLSVTPPARQRSYYQHHCQPRQYLSPIPCFLAYFDKLTSLDVVLVALMSHAVVCRRLSMGTTGPDGMFADVRMVLYTQPINALLWFLQCQQHLGVCGHVVA